MNHTIVHSLKHVLLVGGANIGRNDLNTLLTGMPTVVAVDGGADHLLNNDVQPAAVIGDLDSLSAAARLRFADILHHITEQDTVDFEKALSRIDAPLIYAIGFSGGRLDHTLAVLHVMARHRDRRIVLISDEDVSMIVPRTGLTLDLPADTRVSLMPLVETHCTTTGLRWPLAEALSPLGKTSPSNAAVGGRVHITASQPLIVTLPRSQLLAHDWATTTAQQ